MLYILAMPLTSLSHIFFFSIDLLQQYRTAVIKLGNVKEELDLQLNYLHSPEMLQKRDELNSQEKQLKDIEKKLGMLSFSNNRHCFWEGGAAVLCCTASGVHHVP